MTTEIVEPPLIPTPEQLVIVAIEQLQAQYPNFQPNPADPEYRMFFAFAAIAAETIILAFDVPEAIIRFTGALVYQEPIRPAVFATATATVTANDTLGHTIEAGTEVIVTPESGSTVGFEVDETVAIPPGESTAIVTLRAIEGGTSGNISGPTEAEFSEPLRFIKSIVLTAEPAGGEEEETNEEYTERILELASLIAPRPIVPPDFANFVRLLTTKEKVARAVAIDLLELKHETVEGVERTKVNGEGEGEVEAENVERCVTVIAVDKDGNPLSTEARHEAEDKLKAAREATFKTYVAGPTVTKVNVTVTGKFFKGFTKAGVEENVETALKEYLSKATWGQPQTGTSQHQWINKPVLRRQDIITVLNNTSGFNFFETLKIKGEEKETYTLSGIAPLADAGTLSITLTEGTE